VAAAVEEAFLAAGLVAVAVERFRGLPKSPELPKIAKK
jgi:hypothetical protein